VVRVPGYPSINLPIVEKPLPRLSAAPA
jgi:hypothetical protein